MKHTSKLEKVLIAIACVSFFPMVYLIGRIIIKWIG